MPDEPINNLAQEQEPVQEEPTPEVEDEALEETEADAHVDEPPDPERLKVEIEELRKQREAAEEKAIYWRQQKAKERAEYFRERGQAPEMPGPQTPGVVPEPRQEDYDDYNKYNEAKIRYELAQARAKWELEGIMRNQQQVAMERSRILEEKLSKGMAKYQDFEDVVRDPTATHITPIVRELLIDCENADDVAYYIARNRVEGVQLSKMPPLQMARKIADIDRQFSANNPGPQKRNVTKAPPPIRPVSQGSGVIQKDPTKMTQAEYNEYRRQQGAKPF